MDRRRRVAVLGAVLLVLVAALGVQAVTAGSETTTWREGAYAGGTLLAVQSYGWFSYDNGEALIVDPNGSVRWEFDPPDTRVFDVEMLENGNVQVAMATRVNSSGCPEQYAADHCVHNRIVEVRPATNDIVWHYGWYDAFMTHHEVHDADRLPSGAVAVADMGNDRAFIVDRSGEITWSWQAEAHIGEGTDFWDRYVPADARDEFRKRGPETDWTHMNDVDVHPNGNLQLSIRNFDVVVEVDRETKEIVHVVGRPDNNSVLDEQHNPNRLANGTMLVADSENDRVVELDVETNEMLWSYVGTSHRLAWPRDADRLPNGNTLVVDSRNFRVLEVNETGAVTWAYSLAGDRGIVYDADRLGLPEEPHDVPSAKSFDGSTVVGRDAGILATIESWAGFLFPQWVRVPELLTIAGIVLVALGLLVEGLLYGRVLWRRRSNPPP